MSITKAAIGLLYHIHEEEYTRYGSIVDNNTGTLCSVGQALNMMSGYSNNMWDYDEYRIHVKSGANLFSYSVRALQKADRTDRMEYNNLMYQILASNMPDVADRFGELIGEPSKPLRKDPKTGRYFKRGIRWKWEHTANGEPLGPHGLWMTQEMAKKFGIIASVHISMSKGERIQVPRSIWSESWNHEGMLKQYWNGWWISDKYAFAIGRRAQIIAITPDGIRVQLFKDDFENDLDPDKYKFIDNLLK
jgi:hypothetical protein